MVGAGRGCERGQKETQSQANLDERFEAGHDVRRLENLLGGDGAAVSGYFTTVLTMRKTLFMVK